jgi:hypothetical protein
VTLPRYLLDTNICIFIRNSAQRLLCPKGAFVLAALVGLIAVLQLRERQGSRWRARSRPSISAYDAEALGLEPVAAAAGAGAE